MTSPEFIYTKIVHKFIIREGGSQSNIVALFHAQGGSQKSHEWLSCEILFSYEGGAFTGALKEGKVGLFEQANKGTIFLDEISDMVNLHSYKLN